MPTAQLATVTLAIPIDGLEVRAPLPELISQRNVESVTGIPSRIYLDTIRAPGFPLSVTRIGKLRIVERVAFVAWLRAQGEAAPARPANDAGHDAIAGVLNEVGLDLVEPRRRRGRR